MLAAVFRRGERTVGKRAKRDCAAARRILERAMALHGEPQKITDQSGANTAAIKSYNADHHSHIELRHCKYLNNIVE